MKLSSFKWAASLLALFAALLAGCGGSSSEGSTSGGLPKTIVLGAAIAKSGYLAPYDNSIAAVEQLVKEVNAEGGIHGSKLKVIVADDRSDPQRSPIAAQEVIEQGANVLILSGEALTAAAAAPVAEEHNMLNFTVAVPEPGFGPPTTGRLSFDPYPNLLSEASADATFMKRHGWKKPFLFRDTSAIYGKADCAGFQESWERLGGSIAGSVDFKNEDESIASQVAQLNKSEAGVVMMCSYPPGGASAVKQIRDSGNDLPIVAAGAFDGVYWLKGISNTKDIYVGLIGSTYDPPNPEAARVFKALKESGYDTDVSSVLLSAYAGGQLIVDAIRETGTVEGNALADALEAKPHHTVVGKVEHTEEDHHPGGTWSFYVFANRKPKLLEKITPSFIPEYGG
jgi:branched-chain amino acid transport system substrate-binding protein